MGPGDRRRVQPAGRSRTPPRLGTPDGSGGERRRGRNGRGGAGQGRAWPLHWEAESRATAPAARHGGQRQAGIHTPTRGGEAHTLGRKKTRDHSLSPYHGAGDGASRWLGLRVGRGARGGEDQGAFDFGAADTAGAEQRDREGGGGGRSSDARPAATPSGPSEQPAGEGARVWGRGWGSLSASHPTDYRAASVSSVFCECDFFFFLKDILPLPLLRFLGAAEIWPKFGFKK